MKKFFSLTLAIILIALSARLTIEVPLGAGIPISGQSLAVLLAGWYLKPKLGGWALLLYLLLGAAGLPVFADGASGWTVLAGGSGGFLLSFLPAAILSGFFAQQKGVLLVRAAGAMSLGTVLILVIGLLRLTQLYGWEKALAYGFYPFWPGALIKIILGVSIILTVKALRTQ